MTGTTGVGARRQFYVRSSHPRSPPRIGDRIRAISTDPDEWLMLPQTVNAYYNPGTNEICFPAGKIGRAHV